MTIHPLYANPQDAKTQDAGTAYDSLWANSEVPAQEASGMERIMLAEDKLFVVLGVVLIIWIGIAYFILRTDRKLLALERSIQESIPSTDT